MLRRLLSLLARGLFAPGTVCFTQSAAIAMCVATCCLQWISLAGTSRPASVAAIAALALGLATGTRRIQALRKFSLASFSSATLLPFALAAWIVASPWLVQLNDRVISQPGALSLVSPAWNGCVLFALAVVTLGIPTFLAAQCASIHDAEARPAQRRLPVALLGAAAGFAVWGIGLAQVMGPYTCGVSAAVTGLIISVVRRRGLATDGSASASVIGSESQDISAVTIDEPAADSTPSLALRVGVECLTATVVGGWIIVLDRLIGQLVASSVYLTCGEAIGLCMGLAIGLFAARRCGERGSLFSITSICGLALWGVVVLAAFPLLVDAALWLNASVSSPWVLIATRATAAALVVLPVGITTAGWLESDAGAGDRRWRLGPAAWIACAGLGCGALSTGVFQYVPLASILIACAWLTLALGGAWAFSSHRTQPAGWLSRTALSGAALAIVLAPLWRLNYEPQRSAKLLFNSNIAYAYRSGIKPELLMSMDESRNIATVSGERGEFTVWKYGGRQLQIRENGFPRGVISSDATAFPRYTPETIQVILPCVLFGNVERALVLGLGSSESLSAAAAFPIREIVCLETDAGLVRVTREVCSAETGANPLEDERVSLAVCDPALGLAATPGAFDFIMSCPENLGLAQSQAYLTAEFYRRAASKLSAEGVFCQRLPCIDLGPAPIRTMVRTMQSIFRDVLAFEAAPGELLLVGTNGAGGLIRPELISRLQLPHVRALLAESGLDWTVVLNVAAANHEGLQKFAGTGAATNSASAGRLPLALPREMMRWASKIDEVAESLRPAAGRLVQWIGDDANSPVLVRRLAEVQGQHDLMTTYSDQYWAYRASLRSQVKDKSRSQIQQASATDEQPQMHPEDRRRLQYFTALGRAVKSHRAADIERLVRFTSPYDPLVTFFAYQEAAELSSRSSERDYSQELRYRLHATYFASPRDASLRNVVAALELLREHPEAEPDPVRRWDDLNALLQALKMRWEVRIGVRPSNIREAAQDIDTTVLAAEQTFQVLDALTAEAGLPPESWTARRSVLERTLIRPVRAYQQELLPLLHRKGEKPSE